MQLTPIVFHCFSGEADLAQTCNEHGWYMSFAGPVTFKANDGLREALVQAREDLILVETDAPFLTPHPYRGRPNAPYLVPYTLHHMAEVREMTVDSLAERIDVADRAEHVEATDFRHPEVDHDEIGTAVLHLRERLASAGARDHVVAGTPCEAADHVEDALLVVDDDEQWSLPCHTYSFSLSMARTADLSACS